MKPNRLFPLIISGLVLASCVTSGEPEVISSELNLAPMPKPIPNVGDKWYTLSDGKEMITKVVALNADKVTLREDEGCEWTALLWGFAPAEAWRNCDGADGTQKITAVRGEIWPLAVGKSIAYDLTGSNASGGNWDGTRSCSVAETVRITNASGLHDTFKVVCVDPWTKYTWYMAPELKTAVHFVRYRKRQNDTMVREFIKHEKASPSS